MLHRVEYNVSTGERVDIAQAAYRDDLGDVVVLDAGESPPSGYVEFDPAAAP